MARKPDYLMAALNKKTEERVQRIAVAWKNDDGSITLVLNRFVALPTEPEWLFTLFPNNS